MELIREKYLLQPSGVKTKEKNETQITQPINGYTRTLNEEKKENLHLMVTSRHQSNQKPHL